MARIWVEIVCRQCAHTHDGSSHFVSNGRLPAAKMVKAARKDGWTIDERGEFCSQRCIERAASQSAEERK